MPYGTNSCFKNPILPDERRLKENQCRRILGREVTLGLQWCRHYFVTTRLDYCNSVLAGLPQATIDPLQRVQNAAARLVAGTPSSDNWSFSTSPGQACRDHITSLPFSEACTGFRSGCVYSTSCACLCTWCASVAVLPTWLTWWQPPPIYLVVRDSVPPTVSDTKPQNWSSSLVNGASHTLDQRRGTHFLPISDELTNTDTFKKQLKTHLFKLAYEWRISYDFVDAPLVTLGVSGVVK